jgi:hypothetical protein
MYGLIAPPSFLHLVHLDGGLDLLEDGLLVFVFVIGIGSLRSLVHVNRKVIMERTI